MKSMKKLLVVAGLLLLPYSASAVVTTVNFEDIVVPVPYHNDYTGVDGFDSGAFQFTPGPLNQSANTDLGGAGEHGYLSVFDNHPLIDMGSGWELAYGNNGSKHLAADYDVMMQLSGTYSAESEVPLVFDLDSVDVSGMSWLYNGENTGSWMDMYEPDIIVTGTHFDGSIVTTTIAQDEVVDGPGGAVDFLGFDFLADEGDWTNLVSVLFSIDLSSPVGLTDEQRDFLHSDFRGYLALDNINTDIHAVPEPASWLLFGIGLLALLSTGRQRLS
jgi:hypothetical protein